MELSFTINDIKSKWKKGKFIVNNLQIDMSKEYEQITYDDLKLFLDDKPYDNSIETWAGYKLDASYLFDLTITAYIGKNETYTFGDEWKIFDKADALKEEQDGLIIKLPIYDCDEFQVYELEYATPQFRFYSYYSNFLMLNNEGKTVTDVDAFYTQGLYSEICRVIKGETKCLYKKSVIDRLIKETGGEAEFLKAYDTE